MMKKKICIDARMLYYSGIGTYLRNILFHLQETPYEISLIIHPKDRDKLPWLKSFRLIYCSSKIYSLKEQASLPFKIPKCDLFWSPHINIPLLPIRAKKLLVTIHDIFHLAHFFNLSKAQKSYTSIIFKNLMKKADKIVTDSKFTRYEIHRFFPLHRDLIEVIPLGVDFDFFSNISSENLKSVKKEYQLPSKFFLFVGNLKENKNLPNLLKAFKQFVLSGDHDHSLLIVGKKAGFIRSQPLAKFIEKEDLRERVRLLGFVPENDLPSLYKLATAFVFPSLYEGFGLPVLEAMSAGTAVIASKAASIPEVAKDAALYIDPDDPVSILEAMKTISKNTSLQKDQIEKGILNAQSFSWKVTAKNHLQQMETLL